MPPPREMNSVIAGRMKYLFVVLLAFALGLIGCQSSQQTQMTERQADIAERGAEVMPFDLDATTHIFNKTPEGGVQQVVADSNDAQQVRLIREHLGTISTQFAAGNFHDPAMIHGPEMAGLHALMMGADRLVIDYKEIERGGEITFSSMDQNLVKALHAWFDAQVSDHGEHAEGH